MTIWFVSESGGTGKVSQLTNHTGRVTVSDHTVRDIFSDDAAGTNEAVFSDDYSREYSAINAYLGSLADTGASHTLVCVRAPGMNIIGQDYARGEEDIVFNNCKLGYIYFVMNLDIIPDSASVVDNRVVPDTEMITDIIFLPDNHIMTGFQVTANAAAAVNNSAAAYTGTRTNCQDTSFPLTRRVTQEHPVIDDGVIS